MKKRFFCFKTQVVKLIGQFLGLQSMITILVQFEEKKKIEPPFTLFLVTGQNYIQCILAYPNLAYPNTRISEQPKSGL